MLLSRLNQEFSNGLFELQSRVNKLKQTVEYKVPYVCQFSIPRHAELSLKKELHPRDDTEWHLSGASSQEKYAEWAFTMCGMASASMAIDFFVEKTHKPAVLAEDALLHGVYETETDGTISNMKYREFASWIKNYGLKAKVVSRLSTRGVQYSLTKGNLVIVSVNPNILYPHPQIQPLLTKF